VPAQNNQNELSPLDEMLWAFIGILLTISGTFIPSSLIGPAVSPEGIQIPTSLEQLQVYPLQVTYQIGAVLLIGCLGGKQSATLAQIAYLVLGLSGCQVFSQGGGLNYWHEPTFGYLLGFIPAAWICGYLAFRKPASLENLAVSSVAGLGIVHLFGLIYLLGLSLFRQLSEPLLQAAWHYSLQSLPGQLAMVCVVAVVARLLRLVLIY
jgi:biotin transport system substrate-specific component